MISPILVMVGGGLMLVADVLMKSRAIGIEKTRLATRIDHKVLAEAYDALLADGKIPAEPKYGLDGIKESELPPEIRILKPNNVLFSSDAMYLEFGGGFFHFGLKVLKLPINAQRNSNDERQKIDDRTFIYDY
jgi:hypothetical protein